MDKCTCTKLIHDVAFIETIKFLKLYRIPFISHYRCSATSYIRFFNALAITSKRKYKSKGCEHIPNFFVYKFTAQGRKWLVNVKVYLYTNILHISIM